MNIFIKCCATGAILAAGFGASAPAQTPSLAALDSLQKGAWALKARGASGAGQRVCLGDPSQLLQLEHARTSCSRYVIEDNPSAVRVSYKCGAKGHGVTSIRKESSKLVQIESQGISNNAPFSVAVEGRYVGACS